MGPKGVSGQMMQAIIKRLAVWLCEMALQAVLLGLFLIVSHWSDENAFGKDLLFFFEATALLFFTTGYLFSIAIVRAIWKTRRLWLYPAIATVLFLIHFEIMNVAVHGAFEPSERLRFRTACACIVFACTFLGSWILRKWMRTGGSTPNPPVLENQPLTT
jgi:hypothetical protein